MPNAGLHGAVEALAASSGVLYVGGSFSRSGDGTLRDLNRIAQFTKNGEWAALPNQGLNGPVRALGAEGGALFVGGSMQQTADKAVQNLNNIALFDLGANVKLNQSVRKGSGETYIITLVVINRGPGLAAGISLLDILPSGYRPQSVSAPDAQCGSKKQKVSCTKDQIPEGGRIVVEITAKYTGTPPVVTNCAEVTTTSYDPNPDNHKACARIPAN
jgi:uncharacterized repeat protein (TIGR01451 family)